MVNKFNVSIPIAGSICGSAEKAQSLLLAETEDCYLITNPNNAHDNHFVDKIAKSCSCHKFEQTGIPCSHSIKCFPNDLALFIKPR